MVRERERELRVWYIAPALVQAWYFVDCLVRERMSERENELEDS